MIVECVKIIDKVTGGAVGAGYIRPDTYRIAGNS
jgi:hypothetical protein